ncbi:ABC transporter substrate-binding protein, partial [Pseudomonas aeruginosa]
WYEPARSLYGQFSRAYLSNRIRLLQRKGRGIEFSRLSDLRPYRIAVVRDYAYAPEFDRDSRLQKVNVTSFANAARMLEAGRVDLAVEDELALGVAFKGELADLRDKLEVLPIPLGENGLHLLVSLRNPRHDEIVDGFDLAIRGMRDDGSYQRLLERYGAR